MHHHSLRSLLCVPRCYKGRHLLSVLDSSRSNQTLQIRIRPLNTPVLPCSGALLRATQRSKPCAVTCQFCEMWFATTNTCPKFSDLKPNPTLSQQLATKMPLPLCPPVARHTHAWKHRDAQHRDAHDDRVNLQVRGSYIISAHAHNSHSNSVVETNSPASWKWTWVSQTCPATESQVSTDLVPRCFLKAMAAQMQRWKCWGFWDDYCRCGV